MRLRLASGIMALCLAACQPRRESPSAGGPEWLAGAWQRTTQPQVWEVWQEGPQGEWQGQGLRVVAGDTAVLETLRWFRQGDTWVYEPTVPDQNEGRAIQFSLAQRQGMRWQFENPHHDFPQWIRYEHFPPDSLVATVGAGADSLVFAFRRVD